MVMVMVVAAVMVVAVVVVVVTGATVVMAVTVVVTGGLPMSVPIVGLAVRRLHDDDHHHHGRRLSVPRRPGSVFGGIHACTTPSWPPSGRRPHHWVILAPTWS